MSLSLGVWHMRVSGRVSDSPPNSHSMYNSYHYMCFSSGLLWSGLCTVKLTHHKTIKRVIVNHSCLVVIGMRMRQQNNLNRVEGYVAV